jgi:hypothetical protein
LIITVPAVIRFIQKDPFTRAASNTAQWMNICRSVGATIQEISPCSGTLFCRLASLFSSLVPWAECFGTLERSGGHRDKIFVSLVRGRSVADIAHHGISDESICRVTAG